MQCVSFDQLCLCSVPETSKLICLDSDNESEDGSEFFAPKKNDSIGFAVEMECGSKLSTGFIQSTCFLGKLLFMCFS